MQQSLFGHARPSIDAGFGRVRRIALRDGAWLDHGPEWLQGHGTLYRDLVDRVAWRAQRRVMYERVVDVPRLLGSPAMKGVAGDVLREAETALSARYGLALESITVAYYRDGRDSVAMHADKMGPLLDDTVIAIVSLGEPRRFLLKPVGGGPSLAFRLGWGDLLVMGGTCQRTYLHGVPKAAHAPGRMSVMFRPVVPEAPRARRPMPTEARRRLDGRAA